MKEKDAQELLHCLPHQRTLFPYCRDHYAVQLLRVASKRYPTIPALKRSPFGRLFDKPSVRSLTSACGNGRLDTGALTPYWQEPGNTYLLTVGIWSGRRQRDAQMSRRGANIVLRLHFNRQHDQLYTRTIQPTRANAFNGWGHPVLMQGERRYFRETLAWARLDVDFHTNEVLVEEIQSDWVRRVRSLKLRASRCCDEACVLRGYGYRTTAGQAHAYVSYAESLMHDWSHAMLAAVLHFAEHELGVSTLWYHTWNTGVALKGIDRDWAPPTSLYTRLPEQFCFEATRDMPRLLSTEPLRKRLNRHRIEPHFYKLDL